MLAPCIATAARCGAGCTAARCTSRRGLVCSAAGVASSAHLCCALQMPVATRQKARPRSLSKTVGATHGCAVRALKYFAPPEILQPVLGVTNHTARLNLSLAFCSTLPSSPRPPRCTPAACACQHASSFVFALPCACLCPKTRPRCTSVQEGQALATSWPQVADQW